jgi:hypothetical protein
MFINKIMENLTIYKAPEDETQCQNYSQTQGAWFLIANNTY